LEGTRDENQEKKKQPRKKRESTLQEVGARCRRKVPPQQTKGTRGAKGIEKGGTAITCLGAGD